MKAIKKRLNVREVKDDPEYAKHDEGHEKYSRENLYLCATLFPGVCHVLIPYRYIMTKKN